MGQEIVDEKECSCPCGKGVLKIQVLEHDVYASGRHSRCRVICEDCKKNYREDRFVGPFLIRTPDYEEIQAKWNTYHDRRRALGDKAAQRYLERFGEYVKALGTKTAIREAVGDDSNIDRFRRETKSEYGLNRAIEYGIKNNPAHALRQMRIKDEEIAAEVNAIAELRTSLDQFIAKIPKHKIPYSEI